MTDINILRSLAWAMASAPSGSVYACDVAYAIRKYLRRSSGSLPSSEAMREAFELIMEKD